MYTISQHRFIVVVDEDERLLASVAEDLREEGIVVQKFAPGIEALRSNNLDISTCLVADIGVSGMDASYLQAVMKIRYPKLPLVFVTGEEQVEDPVDYAMLEDPSLFFDSSLSLVESPGFDD